MQFHSKQWFLTNGASLSSYNQEELQMLWETFSTSQLDFLQEVCQNVYNAGYKAAEEDRM